MNCGNSASVKGWNDDAKDDMRKSVSRDTKGTSDDKRLRTAGEPPTTKNKDAHVSPFPILVKHTQSQMFQH
jgi:hypothetical protein